jgi:predicted chitinase
MASFIEPPQTTDPLELLRHFQREAERRETPKTELPKGILERPSEEVDDKSYGVMKFFADWWSGTENKVAEARKEVLEGLVNMPMPTLPTPTSEALDATLPGRESEPVIEGVAPDKPSMLKPEVLELEVDTRSNEALDKSNQTMSKAIEDVLETVVDSDVSDSTDSADGGAAPSDGKGIMSREVDSREDAIAAGPEETIPPQIVFLNDSTTNKGSTERDVYQYAYEQGIKGDELQSFMSQVAHESSKFGRIKEAGYLETKVNDSWVERTPAQIAAKLGGSAERKAAFNALANNKTFTEGTKEQKNNMIFDILYDDQYRAADVRLGNTEVGDGSKYKGRGYIQLTGRDNYKVIGEDIGEDLENNPELMLDPEIAKRASVAWWKRNVRSQQPDYTNTTQITRLVNGRLTGLESRKKYFKRYGEKPTAPQVSLRPSARPDTRVASN